MRRTVRPTSNFLPSKMCAFLAFQMKLTVAMSAILLAFFRMADPVRFLAVHLIALRMVEIFLQSAIQPLMSSHTFLVSVHLKKKWSADSSCASQRAHVRSISINLIRSRVSNRPRSASHVMKDCRGGMKSFQTNFTQIFFHL